MQRHRIYTDIKIWQRSMDFVSEIYKATFTFPKSELYGLTSQIRRAAVSIPSNIAEGSRYDSNKQMKKFLTIAYGSIGEVETQLEIAFRIKFLENEQYERLQSELVEISKMTRAFIKSLKA